MVCVCAPVELSPCGGSSVAVRSPCVRVACPDSEYWDCKAHGTVVLSFVFSEIKSGTERSSKIGETTWRTNCCKEMKFTSRGS